MWGCGLKYDIAYIMDAMAVVTPYVGVWIEILWIPFYTP